MATFQITPADAARIAPLTGFAREHELTCLYQQFQADEMCRTWGSAIVPMGGWSNINARWETGRAEFLAEAETALAAALVQEVA